MVKGTAFLVRLPDRWKKALKQEALDKGISMGEVVREAIANYLLKEN